MIFIALGAIAALAVISVCGPVAALRAIFTSADHVDCRREARVPRSFLPDVPAV
ncbi:hypothetical protein [Pseudorhodoplanes sp.]|jgi:hypothetical protein|uniref:hypothetical protein n=1 Tax=Pseudorhodoplanes sp. TaxID=1934341 RepID=UPI002BF6C191|nr:hypothetical protein [Pseudorhodoplanes sp.]HWV41909.1 hypothetical protein [Pseudorhodoplanes sp.]